MSAAREFLWRLRESPKEYRCYGLRQALAWLFLGWEVDDGG